MSSCTLALTECQQRVTTRSVPVAHGYLQTAAGVAKCFSTSSLLYNLYRMPRVGGNPTSANPRRPNALKTLSLCAVQKGANEVPIEPVRLSWSGSTIAIQQPGRSTKPPTNKPVRSPGRTMNGSKKEEVVGQEPRSTKPANETNTFEKSFVERYVPLPYVLDLRSLALFRILFGLCQLGDIYGRLCNGKYDLAWYTSDPPERSYYYPNMATQEFNGPLGQLFLFRRNSIQAEIAFFVVYGILLTMLTIGFQCQNCWLLPTIWLFTNGLLSKGECSVACVKRKTWFGTRLVD